MSEREQLYRLAKDSGLEAHSRHGVPKLREMLEEAGIDASGIAPDPVAEEPAPVEVTPVAPTPEPEPEAQPEDEPEKLSAEEVLRNKLTAYGVPEDQHKKTLPDLEAQLKRVLAARAKAAEKRKMEDEGDYYGKTAKVRITRMGDDLVGTGEYIAGIGNLCYAAGETADLPLKSAEELQDRGLVEIV